ncbi:MAG TPA: magnesium transporter [Vicinamibacteria bacterium]|nr:magnesium transporter [Vicinamibacteria bacterium]
MPSGPLNWRAHATRKVFTRDGGIDLFAPARVSARNRWVWLAVNLVTVFVASRVIGRFEETIQGLAVLLNLLVAAVVGVAVPLLLHRTGRDPAQGASVLLTLTTDGMGFFIFLGLARAFL